MKRSCQKKDCAHPEVDDSGLCMQHRNEEFIKRCHHKGGEDLSCVVCGVYLPHLETMREPPK